MWRGKFVRRYTAGIVIGWLVMSSALAQHALVMTTEFLPDVASHRVEISRNPNAVLDWTNAHFPPASAPASVRSQYMLLQAESYYSLSLHGEALKVATDAMALIRFDQQPWLWSHIALIKSGALSATGSPLDAIPDVLAAVRFAKSTNDNELLAMALFSRGLLRLDIQDYTAALDDLMQAYRMSVAEPDANQIGKATVALTLGQLYQYREEDKLALPYQLEAEALLRKLDKPLDLSIVLFDLGNSYYALHQLEKAQTALSEALTISRNIGDQQGVAYVQLQLAEFAEQKGQFRQAMEYASQAWEIVALADNPYLKYKILSIQAQVAMDLSNLTLASEKLAEIEILLASFDMDLQRLSFEQAKARLSALNSDYEQAYELLRQNIEHRQIIFNDKNSERIHRLRVQYEMESRERENQLLATEVALHKQELSSQHRSYITLIIVSLCLVLIVGLCLLLVWRNKKHKQHLLILANIDSLTGLANRRAAVEKIERQLALSKRHGLPFCVAIVDLDHFKYINDKFGHQAGDAVLQRFGELCRQQLRKTDICGRMGGEEFVIALPHTHLKSAEKVITTLLERFNRLAVELQYDGMSTSFSAGLTQMRHHDGLSNMLLRADDALYKGKHAGRNQVISDKASVTLTAL